MVAERYALPGQLIVGTDSHTPHSGALGCVAYGVGTTDMANAFVTGAVRLTMPESLRVDIGGPLPAGVTAKDVVLHLLALPALRAGVGVGKVFEFGGPAVRAMSIDERATLTNMVAELGGFTGIVAPDDETQRFLRERRGIEFDDRAVDAQRCRRATTPTRCALDGTRAVADGGRARATPATASPLHTLAERPQLDIAYGGSCTAGKREDFDHYHAVLHWAAERGLRVRRRRAAVPAVRHRRRARLLRRARLPRRRSKRSAPRCCSRRAAPAPTAVPAHPPMRTR